MTDNQLGRLTNAEKLVMQAMDKVSVPYLTRLRNESGLDDAVFRGAVDSLVKNGIVERFSAPHGVLLYDTI